MLEREGVCRATVCFCAFGLQDPENGKPYYGKMAVDVNDGKLARELMRQAHCPHKPHEHQPLRGSARLGTTRVARAVCATVWPKAWCERLLEACEKAWSSEQQLGDDWSLCNATCGTMWEAVAVSSSSVPEENLREELAKQSMTGERYDYVTFSGADLQQPRRLRSMVAHLHVTMGHLSNERLARMLSLTGAAEGIVSLAQIRGDPLHRRALTDYHLGDLTDRPDSTFAREVLQDVWYSVFGPPDLLITDGGPEFAGSVQVMNDLFSVVHEIVPEGAKWRLGHAERHGAIVKLMMMKMVKGLNLKGVAEMRRAAGAAFAAKNRTLNKGGVSPLQAVTGRNSMVPGSIMEQLASGRMRFRYNEAATNKEAVARAERIRIGALEAFHWLDASDALRRALASRSRPPQLEGIREGAVVYLYEPPPSRKGLARRMQDNVSWTGPGVVVCVERDRPVPQRMWVRLRGKVKAYPLEKVRLATTEEMVSADYVNQALEDVTKELEGGQLKVEDAPVEGNGANEDGPGGAKDSSSSSSSESEQERLDPEKERAREAATEGAMEPHELDFAKKQKLFESLSKSFEPPSALQEAQLRKQMEDTYSRVKRVRKAILAKPRGQAGRARGPRTAGRQGERLVGGVSSTRGAAPDEDAKLSVEVTLPNQFFKPGELDVLIQETMGQWTLWSSPSVHAEADELLKVSACLATAEQGGVTEVTTGKARIEYKWASLSPEWRQAYVEPLKKAVGVYLEHNGIRGVPLGQMVDSARVLTSRFVLTNKGGADLAEAELKARWIFGGHKDPDAGLYPTSSPTASVLGHNLLNFVAVQKGWTVHYEDVSAAFLQGKELPRVEKIYVKVPSGYPPEVTEFLLAGLGADMRSDLVELTKAGFGLPESPRLWYLEYRDTIQGLGLMELVLVPGLFRAFDEKGQLKAMASIHVDDTRYAGDETSGGIWEKLHEVLKFGKLRKATDGWQKFCGRWERQSPETLEMEYSMTEYTKAIPMPKVPLQGKRSSESTTRSSNTPSRSSESRARSTDTPSGSSESRARSTDTPQGSCLDEQDTGGEGAGHEEVIRYLEERISAADQADELGEGDRKLIGSIVGQLNWAARQSRYDLCYVASLVQQMAGRGRLDALRWLAQGVRRAQEDVVTRIPNLGCGLEDLVVLSVRNAAFGAMPGGASQGGILIMLASPEILHGDAPACILEGTSNKIHRVVRCSMSAEVSSLATAFEHGDYVRAVFCELVDPTFNISKWKVCASKWPHILVTDARTGYDALSAETLPADRKIAIDVAVLRQGLLSEDSNNLVRWVPGAHMPCDGLTKWSHNKVLVELMTSGVWSLKDTPAAQELRKAAAEKRAIWRRAQKTGT
ncbi:RE1 [Symbiodinium necroappetens]|uniref:RE1 protein n=1 Tax=Symbiodinium necroappetens TaxID=1628268 RepID=A0A812YYN0_9DINO|nr:RE1 [Symbiodinium necroappetens]